MGESVSSVQTAFEHSIGIGMGMARRQKHGQYQLALAGFLVFQEWEIPE